jgi:teichoic acid transport system ATP-binding protein
MNNKNSVEHNADTCNLGDVRTEAAISIRNVAKRFKLYTSPNDRLKELLSFGAMKTGHDFWALRDISFDVPQGASVGIVGRNGSGKSTLLKLICGTMYPSTGEIKVKGRISSLLELGIGFNPELTGRENIYLQGAILGYTKKEMHERAKRITEFADIGEFIDQPVKHYSSGMQVRLAFSCAINVDPDVLIIDEALSVGDMRFQSKCFAKMEELRSRKTTILFVSHSINTVNMFCDSAILLEQGKIIERGEPNYVTNFYSKLLYADDVSSNKTDLSAGVDHEPTDRPMIETAKIAEAGSENSPSQLDNHRWMTDTTVKEARIETSPDIMSTGSRDELRMRTMKIITSRLALVEKGEMRHGNGAAEVIDFGILDTHGEQTFVLKTGCSYTIINRVLVFEDLDDIHPQIAIKDVKGISFFWTNTHVHNVKINPVKRGALIEARFTVKMWLGPGTYFINFVALNSDKSIVYDRRLDALQFEVVKGEAEFGMGSKVNLDPKVEVVLS